MLCARLRRSGWLKNIRGGTGQQIAEDITLNGSAGGMLTGYSLMLYGGEGGDFDATVQFYTGCPGDGGVPIAGTSHTFYGVPDHINAEVWTDIDPPVYIPHRVWMEFTFSTPEAGWLPGYEAEIGYTENRFGWYDSDWYCWSYATLGWAGLRAVLECAPCEGADCTADRYSNWAEPDEGGYYWHNCPDPGLALADDVSLSASGPANLIRYDVVVTADPGNPFDVTASLHTGCPPTPENVIAGTTSTWTALPAERVLSLNADFPPVAVSDPNLWLLLQFSPPDAGWFMAGPAEIGTTADHFAQDYSNEYPHWQCDWTFGWNCGYWANLTFGDGNTALREARTWVEDAASAAPPVQLRRWTSRLAD